MFAFWWQYAAAYPLQMRGHLLHERVWPAEEVPEGWAWRRSELLKGRDEEVFATAAAGCCC